MFSRVLAPTACTLLALLVSGCTTGYVAKVDTVLNTPGGAPGAYGSSGSGGGSGTAGQSGSASGSPVYNTGGAGSTAQSGSGSGRIESFTFESRNSRNAEESLRYRETVGYIRTALSSKGWYEAATAAEADAVVEIDYGLDAPKTRVEERVVPVYANAGGGVRYEQRVYTRPDGTTYMRTVPVFDPPGTKLVGEQVVQVPITTWEKFLKITARENLPNGSNPRQLWSVTVTNEDESNDLRKYIPILVSAALDHLGEGNGQTTVKIKDDSEEVAFIRNGR